jgi:hypothetical protein
MIMKINMSSILLLFLVNIVIIQHHDSINLIKKYFKIIITQYFYYEIYLIESYLRIQ